MQRSDSMMSEYLPVITGKGAEDQGKGDLFRNSHRENGEKWLRRSQSNWKKIRWASIEADLYKSVFSERGKVDQR